MAAEFIKLGYDKGDCPEALMWVYWTTQQADAANGYTAGMVDKSNQGGGITVSIGGPLDFNAVHHHFNN